MAQIRIERQHQLDAGHLRERLEQLGETLVAKYGGEYRWQDNRIHYSYAGGVDAWVSYSDDLVTVEGRLGLLMSAFKGMIQSEVESYLDRKLA